MAKFCTNCGKPLKDDKECTCLNEKSESTTKTITKKEIELNFMDEVKKVFSSLINIFVKPEEVLKENPVSKAWIITMTIQSIFLFIALALGFNLIISLISGGFGGMVDLFLEEIKIPKEVYVKLFLACAAISLTFLFTFATLIYLVVKQFLKKNYNYMAIVNKFSYLSLIISASVLGFALGSFINNYLGFFILGFGLLYYFLTTFVFIKEYFKIEINKAILYNTLIMLFTMIIGSIVSQKILEILLESFFNL